MRDKFNKFMQGRYGVDDLSRFTMGVALVLIILAMFANIFSRTVGSTLDILGVAAIVYAYIRIFSRNIQQRYAENQKFLQMTSKFRFRFNKEKDLMKQRKTHHIYSCPGCGQKIRIPKGKGKIEIECPKCHTKFVKGADMFGYVTVNKPEIKFKDFDVYRSFYCGLCRELRERYGIPGQISLTYDMTFVVLLLSALYEPPTKKGTSRCVVHPLKPQPVRKNTVTEYCADMNVILTYYKCMDDWQDEHKPLRYAYAGILKNCGNMHMSAYPEKIQRIRNALEELSSLEKQGETDVDRVAGCSGRIMEEILAFRKDVWESSLRRLGFYLGKFIYILDAYDDVEKDAENGNYNPFLEKYKIEGFEEEVRRLLMMMLAECCREFEKLPILRYGDILRNILYSGVWCRFAAIGQKRREEREKEKKC